MPGMNGEHDKITPEINEENFESEVLHSRLPALVAFGAHWSKPCQLLEPVLSDVEAGCIGKARVMRVNVDDNPDLGAQYEIESIPTLLCFAEGKVRGRMVGFASKQAILSKLDTFIESLDCSQDTNIRPHIYQASNDNKR